MEYISSHFFQFFLLCGVVAFYASTYIRIIVVYLKTGINHYDFAQQRDKGFFTLFLISLVNLFSTKYIEYAGDLSSLLGSLTSSLQTIGSVLLFLSIILLVISQHTLGNSWKIGLEKEHKTTLITHGVYKYSRHPIFAAMIIFSISVFLLLPTVLTLILLLGNMIALLSTAKKEEAYLMGEFGKEYVSYKKKTGKFFPKIFNR